MKQGNWVALDKNLSLSFIEIRREYSKIEAMFSLSYDLNSGKERSNVAYSRMWSWSRGKVKRFIDTAKTNGQETDIKRAGNGHGYSLLYKGIQNAVDIKRTSNGQATDSEYKEQEQEQEQDSVEKRISRPQIPYAEIISFLNKTANSSFKATTKTTRSFIKARFSEGFSSEDFKTVITSKTDEWLGDEKMEQYLRPQTLFGTKFEAYLQSATTNKTIRTWTNDDTTTSVPIQ